MSNADLKSAKKDQKTLAYFPLSSSFFFLVIVKYLRRLTSVPIPLLNPVCYELSKNFPPSFRKLTSRLFITISSNLYIGHVIVIGLQSENFFNRSLFFGIYIYLSKCCFARRDSSKSKQWLIYFRILRAIAYLIKLSQLSKMIFLLFLCLVMTPVQSSSSSNVAYYASSYSLKFTSLKTILR